jgi:hypothetical protein
MPPTQWIAAALKILAIWLIVDAISNLPAFSGGLVMAFYSSQDPMAMAARWNLLGNGASWLTRVVIGVLMC